MKIKDKQGKQLNEEFQLILRALALLNFAVACILFFAGIIMIDWIVVLVSMVFGLMAYACGLAIKETKNENKR